MSEPPLVSIVTPTFNSARYLEELLRSVEVQDYPRIEHIVIDDGSDDDGATVAILRRHPRVRWWSRENRGQYATLNEGFRAAKGDFVTTISADDTYADPGAIGALVAWLRGHPDHDVAYGTRCTWTPRASRSALSRISASRPGCSATTWGSSFTVRCW